MKNIFLQIFCSIVLLTSSARAFTLGELWIGQYDSFPMGACDDERGWFALRCWTAEIDVNLEAGESGLYVLEWSPDLVTWSELNNNPDIAFPPHASFNGTMNLPGPGTWTMVYPSPPVDVMFLRLKRLGDWVPNLSENKNLTRKPKPSMLSGMNKTPNEIRRDEFLALFLAAIQKRVRALKQDGTVAMSRDNLFALMCRDLHRMPGTPVGTNCAFVAKQYFNDIINANRPLGTFTTI